MHQQAVVPRDGHGEAGEIELMRSSVKERDQQVANVEAFREADRQEGEPRMLLLQQVARERKYTFEAQMEAAKACSLGTMSHSLSDVGGEYWRNTQAKPALQKLQRLSSLKFDMD